MCDVFFFGTAFRMPSHMSVRREGIGIVIEGNAIDRGDDRRRLRLPKIRLDISEKALVRNATLERLAIVAGTGREWLSGVGRC